MDSIRVLRITARTDAPGGVEQYIREVNGMLAKTRVDTYTIEITSSNTKFDYGKESTVIKIDSSRIRRFMNDSIPNEPLLNRIEEVKKTFNPDIIHLHRFRIGYSSITEFTKNMDRPVIFTAHDADLICPLSTLVIPDGRICEGGIKPRCAFTGCKVEVNLPYEMMRYREFIKHLSKRINLFVAPSEALTRYLRSFSIENAKVLRSFIRFPDHVSKLGKDGVFGYIGRIVPEKGMKQLLLACELMKRRGRSFKLLIAGTGKYSAFVKSLIDQNHLEENVEMLGQISGNEKEQFYSDIQFSVIPTIMFDNIPLSAGESMVRVKPVIASDIGGVSELVHDCVNGILVKPYDIGNLADAIEYMMDHASEREKMGKQGNKDAREILNPDSHLKNLLKIYDDLLSGKYPCKASD
ncbi:MAG: glycosyltransferase family 4 protein [Thermoplasmatales archaeon]|nr:glycosyltransferase family 4 protein [Thermoplasmatales archaeon]MCW6170295.1 glycosyltransferase family 4 protein [Thermoplasmatales archaeon]